MAKVPMIENGSASAGITVADTLRRNRKITITTRPKRHQHGELHVFIRFADSVGAVVKNVHLH